MSCCSKIHISIKQPTIICMKLRLSFAFTFLILFSSIIVAAQSNQNIIGIVVDERGQPVKSVTVFISGTQQLTITEDDGHFQFVSLNKGAYHVSATMLGYEQYNNDIVLNNTTINLRIVLKIKSIALNEVRIGSGDKWAEFYRIFAGQFLGTSKNAEDCKILNPKALSFDYSKKTGLLTAHADRFIIIENKRLGYRIRYLLKEFSYSALNNRTLYYGDTNFEELEGSVNTKKMWARNRLEVYQGSMLHFLRSVFSKKVLANGFITHKLLSDMPAALDEATQISVEAQPLNYDTLTSHTDTSFVQFEAPIFYLVYNPKKASGLKTTGTPATNEVLIDEEGTIIKLPLTKAVLDKKGSYTDYRAFLLRGKMAKLRIADLLPFEYQPLGNQ